MVVAQWGIHLWKAYWIPPPISTNLVVVPHPLGTSSWDKKSHPLFSLDNIVASLSVPGNQRLTGPEQGIHVRIRHSSQPPSPTCLSTVAPCPDSVRAFSHTFTAAAAAAAAAYALRRPPLRPVTSGRKTDRHEDHRLLGQPQPRWELPLQLPDVAATPERNGFSTGEAPPDPRVRG